MSVATELTRIQTAKADIKASIEAKGVTVPSDALIDEYADYVDEIQTGGGGGQAEEDLKNLIERDITSITIPSGTTKIGDRAFQYCTALTSVTIPSSVTSIGDNAFNSCGLTSVTIPSGVTSISSYCFASCSSLTSVTIPSSVTSIGSYSFSYCSSLTSVTIPSSVTSIGSQSFRNCGSLTTMTVEATTPPTLGNNAFNNTNANLVIYVPAESLEAYKAANNWSTYASQIQAIPSE